MTTPSQTSLAVALRDVFAASHGEALGMAVNRCLTLCGKPSAALDTLELEYAFNRQFIGPAAPKAPLYASVYLEKEPQIMGESTLEVRELSRALGLRNPAEGSLPDDHLALELDLWLALDALCRATPENEALHTARRWFACEHLALWLPRFLERAADSGHAELDAVRDALCRWLAMVCAECAVSSPDVSPTIS